MNTRGYFTGCCLFHPMVARQHYSIMTSLSQVFAHLLTQYLITPQVMRGIKIGDEEYFDSLFSLQPVYVKMIHIV